MASTCWWWEWREQLESTLKGLKELSSGVLVLSRGKSFLLRVSPGNSRTKHVHSQGCLLHL